jgi:hypothetical protein
MLHLATRSLAVAGKNSRGGAELGGGRGDIAFLVLVVSVVVLS